MLQYDKAQRKDRRALVQDEVHASVEEVQARGMVGMQQQGAWTRWEQWSAKPCGLRQSAESWALSTQILDPDRLQHSTKPIQRFLLGEGGVTSLPSVPEERHRRHRRTHHQLLFSSPGLRGATSGAMTKSWRTTSIGLLAMALDGELKVAMGKRLKFPESIAITLRPDIMLLSVASK